MFLGCPNCKPTRLCRPCVEKHIRTQTVGHPGRAVIAKSAKLSTYPDVCPTHGETYFTTRGRTCVECDPTQPLPMDRSVNPARAEARRGAFKTYEDHCPTHGRTAHHVNIGKCASCFTTAGGRITPRSVRAQARAAGKRTYEDYCPTHALTAFGVTSGKCLSCYTFGGLERTWAPKPTAEEILRKHGWSDAEILAALGPPDAKP